MRDDTDYIQGLIDRAEPTPAGVWVIRRPVTVRPGGRIIGSR
jgi:hypothetical protein